jgi:hypothetical protein
MESDVRRSFKYDPPAAEFKLLRNQGFFPDKEIGFVDLLGGESRMAFETLRERLRFADHHTLPGQAHAEWCIWTEMLPEELRQYQLLFLGTKWEHPKDGEAYTYLYYAGGSWNLGVRYTTPDLHDGFKLAVYQ